MNESIAMLPQVWKIRY